MNVIDRFLQYVRFDTQSSETSGITPSTQGQYVFAQALAEELRCIGLEEVELDEKSYLMATLPANTEESVPVISFIAHLDTSPDMSGNNVTPRILKYNGGDIVLNQEEEIVLSPSVFPELNDYVNQDLIVTNGLTLLGADDKAGVASIISAMQYLKEHPEIKHGKIRVAFTPDEEIGAGADYFDVKKLGADWGYTIDGGAIGELEYENFNAAAAKVSFKGLNVHPGYAKGKMINASLLAMEFASMLPTNQRPEHTVGYEGFYHLTNMSGSVEEASLSYIIRDHDRTLFESKKELIRKLVEVMNEKYPESTTIEIKDQYYNMKEVVETKPYIIDLAFDAMKEVDVVPLVRPIRGGTDGARLSFMGLPCPNIFAGGLNFHGRYEFLPVHSLEKCMQTIVKIAELTARKNMN